MNTTALCIREVDYLLRPFQHRKITLPSRFVVTARPDSYNYNQLRTKYCPGLVVSEPLALVDGAGVMSRFHGGAALREWKRIARAVHSDGACIAALLSYAGPARSVNELTGADLKERAQAYARAAGIARMLGFDAVVIDGGGAQLIEYFLRRESNTREDEYGGDPTRRARFAAQVVHAVRKAVGRRFPIIFRFNLNRHERRQRFLVESQKELREMLEPLCAAGVDIFLCQSRHPLNDGVFNPVAWIRKISERPVIAECPADVSDELLLLLVRRMQACEFDLLAIPHAD